MMTAEQKTERHINRQLPPEEIVELMKARAPEAIAQTKLVGAWLWTTFDAKPERRTIDALKTLGFSWNASRQCWQNPCGRWTARARAHNPRDTYGEQDITQ